MADLFLAIACSTSIGAVIRLSEGRRLDRATVTLANYITALVLCIVLPGSSEPALQALAALPRELSSLASAFPSSSWPLISGIPSGVLYLLGILWYQKSVRECGVGLAGGVGKLGVVLPVVASALFWDGFPGGIRLAGVATAVAATALGINGHGRSLRLPLLLFFLFGGLADFSGRVFQRFSPGGGEGTFLIFVFASAAAGTLVAMHPRPSAASVGAGAVLGIPNALTSWFLIRSLRTVPAPVAFSAFGAGTIFCLGLLGWLAFGERTSGRERVSIGLAAVAVVLLNA